VVLLAVTLTLNQFLMRSTSAQINNILSLMSEKVNTSFDMMMNYVHEAAEIISADSECSFEESYEQLQKTTSTLPYASIGLIDADGKVYGSDGEKTDIERQDFFEKAMASDDIYISEPYRSSVTGTNMIAMFSPIYRHRQRAGALYAIYYLETIQNLAYTNILSERTSVFLMNPYSGNFVNCSILEDSPPGTWNNLRLVKSGVNGINGYDFDNWLKSMRNGSKNNLINLSEGGKSYTMAYIDIKGMNNWYIVIRIPLAELSDTMQKYTIGVIIGAALLILATIILAAHLYAGEHRQNETLQDLSNHDPLTKVLNRRAFETSLNKLFAKGKKHERYMFMFFDIDYFKSVNDNYGHDAGDQVLCATAKYLSDAFWNTGIVARIGGDEFNVLVYKPLSIADMDEILAALRMNLKQFRLEDGTPLPVSFSAGIAVFPQDADDLKTLRDNADKALYYVKELGRNNHFWYHDMKK
ncbi:MAG: GGDEF domain-containing protein, partial [Firmicutes bacterium]|nr:GGDEF domain-containing protein [Bacillota bacterium]